MNGVFAELNSNGNADAGTAFALNCSLFIELFSLASFFCWFKLFLKLFVKLFFSFWLCLFVSKRCVSVGEENVFQDGVFFFTPLNS